MYLENLYKIINRIFRKIQENYNEFFTKNH